MDADKPMYALERQFVKTLTASLDDIEAGLALRSPERGLALQGALSRLDEACRPVHARSIARAAQRCSEIVTRECLAQPRFDPSKGCRIKASEESLRKFRAAFFELSAVAALYAGGLYEIDPEFEAEMKGEIDAQPSVSSGGAPEAALRKSADIKTANAEAAAILSPLLPLVKEDKLRGALGVLMQKQGREEIFEMPSVAPAQNQNISKTAQKPGQSFDALMRPVTNLMLSEARHSGKSVSVSYVSDIEKLPFSDGQNLQDILEMAGLAVVNQGVRFASAGEDGGLPKAMPVPLSISAKTGTDMIRVHLAWRGAPLSKPGEGATHFAKAIAALEAAGGAIHFRSPLQSALLAEHADSKAVTANHKTLPQALDIELPLGVSLTASAPRSANTPFPLAVLETSALNIGADLTIPAALQTKGQFA